MYQQQTGKHLSNTAKHRTKVGGVSQLGWHVPLLPHRFPLQLSINEATHGLASKQYVKGGPKNWTVFERHR